MTFDRAHSPPPRPSPQSKSIRGLLTPYLPAVLLFLSELSELLLVSPRIRLLESSICRRTYPDHPSPIPEELCKTEEVQSTLAYIRGWQVFWEAIPVLLLAVPWGAAADRIGRKKVLLATLAGCALHILWFLAVCSPSSTAVPEAVWVGALAFVLGGGPRTGGVLILALVTDDSEAKKRSERFYYTYSAFLLTELVAPPMSAALMAWSLLAPFGVALAALALAVPVLGAVEGKKFSPPQKPATPRPSTDDDDDDDDDEAAAGLLTRPDTPPKFKKTRSLLTRILATPRPVLLVLFGHFLCPIRQELVFQIMIPYASRLFSVPIARAGLLLSIVALSNLLTIVLILPRLQRHLRLPPIRTDATIAALSAAVLAVGCTLLGFAPNYPLFAAACVVFAAGFGIRLALLSLLTHLVPEGSVGRWYTVVTVVEGLGEMGSAAALQGVWVLGLRWGGWWTAGSWWVSAVMYGVGAGIVRGVGR